MNFYIKLITFSISFYGLVYAFLNASICCNSDNIIILYYIIESNGRTAGRTVGWMDGYVYVKFIVL